MRRLIAALALAAATACSPPTVNTGNISDGSSGAPVVNAASNAQAQPAPTWGKRYTWPDKLAIEIAAPTPCKPSKYAAPQGIQRAVKVTVTVINGSPKAVDTVLLTSVDAQFGGKPVESVYDSGGACKTARSDGTVLPGKTFTYELAYAVEPQQGELQLEIRPDFAADKAVFVGPA